MSCRKRKLGNAVLVLCMDQCPVRAQCMPFCGGLRELETGVSAE
jgi:hypothetical protein